MSCSQTSILFIAWGLGGVCALLFNTYLPHRHSRVAFPFPPTTETAGSQPPHLSVIDTRTLTRRVGPSYHTVSGH